MLWELVIDGNLYGVVDCYHLDTVRNKWLFKIIGGALVTIPNDAIKHWGFGLIGHDIELYDGRQPVFEYAEK